MADKRIALELTIGLQDANKSLEELNELLKQAKTELDKAGKGSKEFRDLEKAVKKTEAQMAKSNKTTKTLNGTTKDLNKNLKATKDTTANLGGTLDNMSGITGGLGSRFTALRGVVGGVVKSFRTLRGAILATGIGALILSLVALQKAFTTSEEGQNKFAKLMGMIGAVVGNVVDLLADLGEAIISTFTDPISAVKTFGESILNFIKNPIESTKNAIKGATEATKEFIKEQQEEAKLAGQVADMRAKADKIDRALLVERSKLQSDIAELRLKARKEDEFSAAVRREALLEAQRLEDILLDKETKALELRRDAQILENTFSRTDKENLDKEARARAAVNAQIARRANVARQLQRELNTIAGQQRAEQTKADNEEKAAAKEKADALEAIRQAEIVSIEDKRKEELRAEKEKYDNLIEQAKKYGQDYTELVNAQYLREQEIKDKFAKEDAEKLLAQQEKKIADLQYEQEQEEETFQQRREELARRQSILLKDETLTEAQRLELQNQFAAESKKIDDDVEANRKANVEARVQLATDVLGTLSALTTAFAKDDEASQKKAFQINKAIAIGQAVISTAQGITAQLAVPQDALTGANFVKAGIVAATGAAQIATISKTQFKGTDKQVDKPTQPTLGGGIVGLQPRGFISPQVQTDIPTTKVIVTETDIRSVSRNVDGVYSRATVVQ